jgi:hypothetical protein
MDDEQNSIAPASQPSHAPPAPPAASEQPQPPLWRRRPVQIGAVALLAAVGVGVGIAASSGSGNAQIHVRGTLQLGPLSAVATSGTAADGGACTAGQGYDDITPGTTVTIGGDHGQTLGVGPLSTGVERNVDDSLGVAAGNCVFSFDVPVAGGQSAYTVTISHRGTQTFTPAQVADGVALTLGQ